MKYTYDLNTNGCLILTADIQDREMIKHLREDFPKHGNTWLECEALDRLIANSELDWIQPEEIAALTSAPILGIRGEDGEPIAAWAFMDYAVRSFLDDLIDEGKAVFIS